MQQLREIAERMPAQQRVLAVHQCDRAHLLLAGGEVVVPEERHALGERRWRIHHFSEPPATQFEAAARLAFLEGAALLGRCIAQGAHVGQWLVHPPGWQHACLALCPCKQLLDRLFATQRRSAADFIDGGAETRATEQMACVLDAHAGQGDPGKQQRDGEQRCVNSEAAPWRYAEEAVH